MIDTAALILSALAMGTGTAALIRTFKPAETTTIDHDYEPVTSLAGGGTLIIPADASPDGREMKIDLDLDPEESAKRIQQVFEQPRTESLIVHGGWYAPKDQTPEPFAGPEEKQFEPSPFLTAHQRTDVLKIAREKSVEAALSKEAEYLAARHGRRVRSQA